MPDHSLLAVYNRDDDTLRLSWPGLDHLPGPTLAAGKDAGFRLWRGSGQLVATWTPDREDWLSGLGLTVQEAVIADDSAARAARHRARSDAATTSATEHARAASQNLPPMGEPIKRGHHSQRRHELALERSERHSRQALDGSRKAEHYAQRAEGTERHARNKIHPTTIRSRIKGLEAELRSWQRRLTGQGLGAPTSPEGAERWIAHLQARLAFERGRLAQIEPTPPPAPLFEVGEVVWWPKFGRCELLRVGSKNCRVKVLDGGASGLELRAARDELTTFP